MTWDVEARLIRLASCVLEESTQVGLRQEAMHALEHVDPVRAVEVLIEHEDTSKILADYCRKLIAERRHKTTQAFGSGEGTNSTSS